MQNARILVPALVCLLLGGACSVDGIMLPSPPLDDLGFGGPYTREGDYRGALMLVGDTASVQVVAFAGGLSAAPGKYTLTLSDLAVVRMLPHAGSNAFWSFVALGPGSATITLDGQGFHQSRNVTVLSALPPLDGLRIRVHYAYAGDSSYVPVMAYGPDGSLSSVTVPVRQSVSLEIDPLRAGGSVWGVGSDVSVASPAIAQVGGPCRPIELDPDCSPPGSWVIGVAPGETTVSVSARGLTTSFAVTVEEATP